MYEVQLRTWNVVWFGIREPDWEDEEWEEEEEEFSLRNSKKKNSLKGGMRIRKNP
ncbi:hypothetical protein SEA_BILLNYE_220 [Streptomyces phage BillNye]|uniref:Uncharacterized protein n=2 Tax=Wilnyevirus billnye TaxID=2560486 RepID=A0A2L1IW30_9CAUD|nr:hypothetical protein FDJ30_gp042 [Streptomyces phage BillNye]AVD99391.1 hypothetical protein SEA_BILLNYE_220 [Streptomyces phage BillNye]QBZ72473.1 hypothetical protein SEA_CIRCINUS_220 [Streptomyces phage Circinus]